MSKFEIGIMAKPLFFFFFFFLFVCLFDKKTPKELGGNSVFCVKVCFSV